MFAAAKADLIEYCIFDGPYDDITLYPRWMKRVLLDDCYMIDEVMMFGDRALSSSDVFLRNKYGEVRLIDIHDFQELFMTCD